VRELLRRPLYARFDSIDHKLNFILHDVTAKADNLSAKTDQALWTISKKLDTYVADLQEYQIRIRQVLSQESAAGSDALTRFAAAADLKLSAIDAHVADLRGLIADTETRGSTEQTTLRAILEDERRRIAEFERQLTELRRATFPPSVAAGENVVATEIDGFIVGVPGEEWRMAAYHAFRGVMEPGLVARFRSLIEPGMVVVDVGANIGIFTLYAARSLQAKGRIYSFEPTPRTFRILKDNVQVNGFLELGVIELHQTAVSDRAGTSRFVTFAANSGHNTLFEEGVSGDPIDVATVTLDQALAAEPRIDVVKIDAEGAEPLILRGMREVIARSPGIRILMEFAPEHLRRAGVDPAAFLDEIAALGFGIRQVHDETGELLEVSRDRLTGGFSPNLELSRSGECGGHA
jgi:FkbM family methyltransferase